MLVTLSFEAAEKSSKGKIFERNDIVLVFVLYVPYTYAWHDLTFPPELVTIYLNRPHTVVSGHI